MGFFNNQKSFKNFFNKMSYMITNHQTLTGALQSCRRENKENLSDLERKLYSAISPKFFKSEQDLTYDLLENSNLLVGHLRQHNGNFRSVALQRIEISLTKKGEIDQIENIFKNYKKWKHNNIIQPVGLTYLRKYNSFYLLLKWGS